jgi:2,4-dienoyl-CoA reductase-like NADH-dependent reductase (Old Yellow Enzyme family)
MPKDKLLLVKLNSFDDTFQKGVNIELATKYSKWLVELGIDAIEISCGSSVFTPFSTVRGDVPLKECLEYLSWWKKPVAKMIIKKFVGKYQFEKPYNLEAAKAIKPFLGDVPLILVGGIRRASEMEQIIENKYADFISMSRPFIREPNLVKNIQDNGDYQAQCVSCNRCTAAVFSDLLPIRCYNKNFPKKKE